MNQLATFTTIVLALSVASERMVEVLKGFLPNFWLFHANPVPAQESRRVALLHVLAGICGGCAAYCSHVDLLSYLHSPRAAPAAPMTFLSWHGAASFAMAALLTSAGSAFWNQIIDLLTATKVQSEQSAIAAVGANQPTLP
jgi:hypothetical protein